MGIMHDQTDIVYVYKPNKTGELAWSIASLKNIEHRKVHIVRDTNYRWSGFSKYHNQIAKLLDACNNPEVSDNFILMNDDFFCFGVPCISLLNDDTSYDIIDVYDMFCKWLQENETGFRLMCDAQTQIQTLRRPRGSFGEIRETWNEVDTDLQNMAEYENEVSKSESDWLQLLGWKGDNSLQEMAKLYRLLRRYGGSTTEEIIRQIGFDKKLLQRKLPVGYEDSADAKRKSQQKIDLQWRNAMPVGVAKENWDKLLQIKEIWGICLNRKEWQPVNYNRGTLQDHVKWRKKRDGYSRSLVQTDLYLTARNYPTLSFELHTPFVFNKRKLKYLINTLPKQSTTVLQIRSLYGNMYNVDTEYHDDVKNTLHNVLMSSSNASFKTNIGNQIRAALS